MTRARLLAALLGLLLAPAAALAQAPDADWRTLETAHFRLHYPASSDGAFIPNFSGQVSSYCREKASCTCSARSPSLLVRRISSPS